MLALIFIVTTLAFTGSLLVDGAIMPAIVFLIGSVFGFAGGSGMRASLYRGAAKPGAIIGLGLLFASGSAVLYQVGELDAFGLQFSADNWVFVAFALGFLATRRRDAIAERVADPTEDEVAMGLLSPIAAQLVAGRMSAQKAEEYIKTLAQIAPEAPELWNSLSANERDELGLSFMRLAAEPEVAARIERQLESFETLAPELWEQSLNRAKSDMQ